MNNNEKMIAFLTLMVIIQALCSASMYAELSADTTENTRLVWEFYDNDIGHYKEFIDYANNHNSPIVLIVPDGYIYQGEPLNSSEFSDNFIPNVEYYDQKYFIEELRSGARYKVYENNSMNP